MKSVSRIDEIVYARSALSISSIDVVVGFCDDEHQGPGPKLRQCPRWTSSDAVLAPMSRPVVITRLALFTDNGGGVGFSAGRCDHGDEVCGVPPLSSWSDRKVATFTISRMTSRSQFDGAPA